MKKTLWIIVSLFLALITIFAIKHESILCSMESFLIVNEEPKPVDVIIVLGGGPSESVYHGVRLYQSGYASRILFTGGAHAGESTEAQVMMRQALYLGVPKEDILVEEKSLTTYENAKYSLDIIKANDFESVIVVASPYHTRRSSLIFSRLFEGIEFTVCSFSNESYSTSEWWQDRYRTRFILSEYLKIVWFYLFSK
jgi:uncharacterized SAM-binding protein YcdF (DUF218 family)